MNDVILEADEYSPGPALIVFWHKARKQFVPLTSEEFERKARVSRVIRTRLVEFGYLRKEPIAGPSMGNLHVLEITKTGKAALRRWLM